MLPIDSISLLLDSLRNLISTPEYRPASDRLLAFLHKHSQTLSESADTESRTQAILASIQLFHPSTHLLCNVEKLVSLLPRDPAMDALCMLAVKPAYRLQITHNLHRIQSHFQNLPLFSVITLVRNLCLSSLDKALLAVPSQYSDVEMEQARSLMDIAGEGKPETEEEAGAAKQLIVASGALPDVLKLAWKARKSWTSAMHQTWLEAVFSLSEVKEARSTLMSHEALTGVLKSAHSPFRVTHTKSWLGTLQPDYCSRPTLQLWPRGSCRTQRC